MIAFRGARTGALTRPTARSPRCARWFRAASGSLVIAVATAPLESQGTRPDIASRYRLELGAAASTPIIEDGNGVAVRRGIGPFAAADATWALDERIMMAASVRGSVAPLNMRSNERRWSGGRVRQLDLALGVERPMFASVAVGAGLAVALLHGPDDIIPFRGGRGMLYGWGPEVSIAARISRARRIDAVLAGGALRIRLPKQDTPVVGGWVGRLRLGVRHAL